MSLLQHQIMVFGFQPKSLLIGLLFLSYGVANEPAMIIPYILSQKFATPKLKKLELTNQRRLWSKAVCKFLKDVH